jgi:hypothetical protein
MARKIGQKRGRMNGSGRRTRGKWKRLLIKSDMARNMHTAGEKVKISRAFVFVRVPKKDARN